MHRKVTASGRGVLAILLVLLLAGCSTLAHADRSRSPFANRTSSSPTPAVISSPGSSSQAGTASATPGPTTALASADIGLLGAERASFNHGDLAVTNLVLGRRLPGLAHTLDVVRGQILREHAWAGGGPLTVTASLTASSPNSVGVVVTAEAPEGTHTAVVYHDPTSNQSFASSALISPAGWQPFVDEASARTGTAAARAAAQLGRPGFPNGEGPAIGFSAAGDLVVVFQPVDGSTIAPVLVPAAQSSGWLTELGRRVRSAAQHPTPVVMPTQFTRPDPGLVGMAAADPRPPLRLGTDCAVKRCVALTFDDGPVPQTRDLVAELTRLHAPATFFALGTSVDSHPDVLADVAASGMQIGSHQQVHQRMTETAGATLDTQVTRSVDTILEFTGQPPLFLRPPYGVHNRGTDRLVVEHGMSVALWSVDTEDWKHTKDPAATAQAAILALLDKEVGNGAVVLMHDIHANSRAAVPAVVARLRAQGYTLVTLSELAPDGYRFGVPACKSPAVQKSCAG